MDANLQWLDYTALSIYMFTMAGIGIFLGKFIRNIGDYFKGGNCIPWPLVGISNYMGLFSTFIFVAYAGVAYEHGLVAVVVLWSTVPASLVGAFIFAKRWRRAGITSPVEFLETRFNSSTRQIFSWTGLGFRLLDNMVRLYALGVFISAATPMNLQLSIVATGLIIALYTVFGGLWAVVLTDLVQFFVLIFATIIMVPLSLKATGGLFTLMSDLPEHFTWFHGPRGEFLFLLAYYVMIIIKYNGNWSFIQRFYSVRDETSGMKAGILMAILFFIFPLVFLLPAIAVRSIIPDLKNPEMAYVAISIYILPPGIMGIMLASTFAATMSAVDSEMNVMSGVITNDIYKRLIYPDSSEKALVWVARISTVGLALLIVGGALFIGLLGGAFEANRILTGLLAIPLVIPILLSILLRKPRPWGSVATILVGVLWGLVLNIFPQISWEIGTLIQIVLCVSVFILSGYHGSSNPEYCRRVDLFFERLNKSIPLEELPKEDPKFTQNLIRMLVIVFIIIGMLFITMSVVSWDQLSGILSSLVGLFCLCLGGILYKHRK